MASMRTHVAAAAMLLLLTGPGLAAESVPSESSLRRSLDAASVALGPDSCSGVLAEDPQLILTARHCIKDAGQSIPVRLSNGERRTAWIVATDQVADQAVLFLEDPAPLRPLSIARRREVPGTVLYFEGHPLRPRFQRARLDRICRCPSLPQLPNALFTSIDGTPGDSGAPLVDAEAHVVGLVHGGAQCQIATPADTLLHLVDHFFDSDELQIPTPPH